MLDEEFIHPILETAILLIIKEFGFKSMSIRALRLIRDIVIDCLVEIANEMKDLSESALRPCIELNDVRLSFIKAGWSFDDIFLEDYTRSKIEEIQHIYLESDEEVDELPFSSLEHQEEKLRQMEYLDLHFIQPYLPDFPRLHTFLSEPVEREFDLDYMAARRFKCLQHKDIMNSKMQKLEKEADTVTLKLVGSNETFVGTLSLLLAVLPPKRKEY